MAAKPQEPARPPARPPFDLAGFTRPPAQAGLSLEQLNVAFAEMLRSGSDPYDAPGAPASADSSAPAQAASIAAGVSPDEQFEITPRSILEAMLFVGRPDGQPITSQEVAQQMRGVRAAEIDGLVRELNSLYEACNCPYFIVAEGAGYRMRLREALASSREEFYGKARQAKLSEAAIEVLAIVAYNEPASTEEINRLRGTPSGHVLAQLVRRELLRLEPGHTHKHRVYRTAPRFLKLFELESLDDLPRWRE